MKDTPHPLDTAISALQSAQRRTETMQNGGDADFLIQQSVNRAMGRVYTPLTLPLREVLENIEFYGEQMRSREIEILPVNMRSSANLIGSMIASWDIQGFGDKDNVVANAQKSLADKLLLASAYFKDQPNVIPKLDKDQAATIAEDLKTAIQENIQTVRKQLAGSRGV